MRAHVGENIFWPPSVLASKTAAEIFVLYRVCVAGHRTYNFEKIAEQSQNALHAKGVFSKTFVQQIFTVFAATVFRVYFERIRAQKLQGPG